MRDVKVVEPGAGRIISAAGDFYTFKAVSDDTGCAYTLLEAVVPKDGGSFPHIHHREDEGFYILEGEIIFYAAGQIFTKGPGSFVNIPKGTVHYFKNRGAVTAKMLILYGPAGFERVFFESGTEVKDLSAPAPPQTEADGRKFLEVAAKYGTEVLWDMPVEI
jgi:mannose-6-phosphate isomerase-like protein (cupin superfamily)